MSRTTLVTGFPTSFLAARMVRKVLEEEPRGSVVCVVQEKFLERAATVLETLPASHRERVRILEGDVAAMDMGLSGAEFLGLAREVEVIQHCAAATYLGVGHEVAERLNVDGTREVLELAGEASHLTRLVHWSTAMVCGARRGYVLEEELAAPDGFRNPIEETRHRAEVLVRRASKRLPITVLRPATIVGDSVTGEIDRFEGPYLLVMVMLSSPVDLRMPLPGRGDIPLNLVPVDYVVDAGFAIASEERSLGRAYHLVDPHPHSARRVFELVAEAVGRPLPRGFMPTNLATALLRTPGIERFAHVPRAFLEQLATEVVFDDRNTREVLDPLGLRCPQFDTYVDVMVQYVRQQQADRRASGRPPRPDLGSANDEEERDALE